MTVSHATTARRPRCLARVVPPLAAALVVAVGCSPAESGALPAASPTRGPDAPAPGTQAADPADRARPEPLRVGGLPTGAPPRIAWWEPGVVHRTDGTRLRVARALAVVELAPLARGALLGVRDRDEISWVTRVRPGHAARRIGPLAGRLATSAGGNVVGWASPAGAITIAQRGGREIWTMPRVSAVGTFSTVGVTSEDCKEGRSTPGGCAVYVAALGPAPTTYASVSHGFSDIASSRIRTAYDVSDDARSVVGAVSYDRSGRSCSGLQATAGHRLRWRNCDVGARELSPSGDLVVAMSSALVPAGADDTIAMVDARSGRTLWWLRDRRQSCPSCVRVADVTWEDDDQVLAVVFRATHWNRGEWSVVRFSADGPSMEYAVAPRPGPAPWVDGSTPPVVLAR